MVDQHVLASRLSALEGYRAKLESFKRRDRAECRFADETVWMSQAPMAELFQTTPQNITST